MPKTPSALQGGATPTESSRRTAVRRLSLHAAIAAALWSVAISLTGGILFHAGTYRVSSRNPVTPIALSAIACIVALAVAPAGRRIETLAREETGPLWLLSSEAGNDATL